MESKTTASKGTVTGMDEIWVRGGKRLSGSVRASGSKNATLPVLAAALLAPGLLVLLLPAIMVTFDPGEVWKRVKWADGASGVAPTE